MITAAPAGAIWTVLENVSRRPDMYQRVVICAPFIDDDLAHRVLGIREVTRRCACGFTLITSPTTASRIVKVFSGHRAHSERGIRAVKHLHAKLFLADARRTRDSRVFITSANLTRAALRRNVEFGILASASTEGGRLVVNSARSFLNSLVTPVTPPVADRKLSPWRRIAS